MAKGKPTPRITDTGLKAPRPKLKDVTPEGGLAEEVKRAKSRQSAQASKNPVSRAIGYVQNIRKEAGDYSRAWNKSVDANMARNDGPPSVRKAKAAEANATRNRQDKEMGQLAGAILQGRRYDRSGKQIKK